MRLLGLYIVIVTLVNALESVFSQELHGALIEFSKDLHRLELVFPEPSQRNPVRCELYEEKSHEECNIECRVQIHFMGALIGDNESRRLQVCRPQASPCQKVVASRDGAKVTTQGACDRCKCVYLSEYLKTSRMSSGNVNDSSSSQNATIQSIAQQAKPTGRRALLRIRIPDPSVRNSTACEPYESTYIDRFPCPGDVPDGCEQRCVIDQRIGTLRFSGPVRILRGRFRGSGHSCYLKPTKNDGLSVEGAKLFVRGQCDGGVCVLANRPFRRRPD